MTLDERYMAAALALAVRGRGQTAPSPCVGCVLVKNGHVIGRGWSQKGGRPHAEAVALTQAGEHAHGATAYVTLEPCAHISARGPACTDALIAAGIERVVIALTDPDPRTNGKGIAKLRAAGIYVTCDVLAKEAAHSMAGFVTRQTQGRPHITLKLATSLDGMIAMPDGQSRWITGSVSRAHAHVERSLHDIILIGRGTYICDASKLDVRLPGLEGRSPRRAVLSQAPAPAGWESVTSPKALCAIEGVNSVLVEGGTMTASAFLREDMVDRLLLYRAPIVIGSGKAALSDIGLTKLADAHGRWQHRDSRKLGQDSFDEYERVRS